jgi:5,6-dimethylbenzimidazole synthase
MPDMLAYSVVAAICTMWLAARAQGIVGWVSILTPAHISKILEVPDTWRLIGYFCLGYPKADDDRPELERARWETRRRSEALILRR